METLSTDDANAIIRLLSQLSAKSMAIPTARRMLIDGMARIIQADVYFWVQSRMKLPERNPMAFFFLDGGWIDDRERGLVLEAATDPQFNSVACPENILDRHLTRTTEELLPPDHPVARRIYPRIVDKTGIEHLMMSIYPLDRETFSGLAVHRRKGKPPYTARERAIVHLITGEIDWLHRNGSDVPANADTLFELTQRERQVLLLMLTGQSRRRIADTLGVSLYTVHDYVKSIYRRFSVNSHSALISKFMSGGRPQDRADQED